MKTLSTALKILVAIIGLAAQGLHAIPSWLNGSWRIDSSTMSDEFKKSRTWSSEQTLGFIALAEAAVSCQFRVTDSALVIKRRLDAEPTAVAAIVSDASAEQFAITVNDQKVVITREDDHVYASMIYENEPIKLRLERIGADVNTLLPSWLAGEWLLDAEATIKQAKANSLSQSEAPPILALLHEKELTTRVLVAGGELTMTLFGETKTHVIVSARDSAEKLDLNDSSGQLLRFYKNEAKNVLIWKLSSQDSGIVFSKASDHEGAR